MANRESNPPAPPSPSPGAALRRYGLALALFGAATLVSLGLVVASGLRTSSDASPWDHTAPWLALVLTFVLVVLALESLLVFKPMRVRFKESQGEMERSRKRLAYLAYHDNLTDLPNRLSFLEQLECAMEAAQRNGHFLAVLQLDLDRFKEVNNTLGRAFGDRLIIAVKQRLTAVVASGDSLARLTGDEFAVLRPCLQGATEAERRSEAQALAERISRTLSVPFLEGGTRVFTGATVGIALFPGDGESGEELLTSCDLVLDHAKESNLGEAYFYEPSLRTRVEARKALETDLRTAVVRRQLVAYYQPQVRLSDGAVVGLEALMRWEHPERGLVPVSEFLEIAEVTGLIGPIGESVLRQACTQLRRWIDIGLVAEAGDEDDALPFRLSVNLSAHQLRRETLPEVIQSILAEHRLPPEMLEIEVTEGTVLSDGRRGPYEILRQIHDLGVSIALDDFGTGFASLTHVNRWPVDRIKVDHSFVARMVDDPQEAAVVKLILKLAESLELEVIAEGVEQEIQAEMLERLGCSLAQGFLFAHPIPAEQVAVCLERGALLGGGGEDSFSAALAG